VIECAVADRRCRALPPEVPRDPNPHPHPPRPAHARGIPEDDLSVE
jgi:hypothetical protein